MISGWKHSLLLAAGLLMAVPAAAQSWSVDVRGADLDHALRTFAERTGTAVAYDPDRVRGVRVTCGVSTGDVEVYLACLLSGTGLEYFRRASGTYVIGPSLALPAAYGVVTGQVEDADTGNPLALAHIRVGPEARWAVTGAGGRFVLADLLPGRYRISVSHLGYGAWEDSVDVVSGSATRIVAPLRTAPIEAAPIVIEQSASPPTARDARRQVGEVRVRMPGAVSDLTGGLQIHGSAAGDLQLRLDGHPVYFPRQLVGLFGPFSSQAVDRIRVYQSGFGAETGSLLGGVVDFGQTLGGVPGFVAEANSHATEGSLVVSEGRSRVRASGRTSHLSRTRPSSVLGTLEDWSTTDPFLLFAPTGELANANESRVNELYSFSDLAPTASFSDLNAAWSVETRPGLRVHGTAYHGRRGLSGDRRADGVERAVADAQPFLSAVARHQWRTSTGAVGVRALLGTQAFASGSMRFSRYRYQHGYRLANPRADQFAAEVDSGNLAEGDLPIDLSNSNRLDEWQVDARLDAARGRHFVSMGLEAIGTTSAYALGAADMSAGATRGFLIDRGGGIDTLYAFVVGYRNEAAREQMGRLTFWLSDRFEGERLVVEGGARFTWHSTRTTVYAEPRMRLGWRFSPDLTAGVSAGLYRQFVLQFDYSTVNAGEVVPSTRIWLPVPGVLSPPRAVHVAAAAQWQRGALRTRVEAYAKRVDGGRTPNYLWSPTLDNRPDGHRFLAGQDARHIGIVVDNELENPLGLTRATLRLSRDRVTSAALFGGRTTSAPWSVPRTLALAHNASWNRVGAGARLTWESGMRWGLRQAYYDYYRRLATAGRWNLSDPDAHSLPDRVSLDVSLSWRPRASLEAYAEVENLLDRRNELDWRLLHDGSELRQDPRYLPGRTVVLGVKARF